jgi:hypothetical protein
MIDCARDADNIQALLIANNNIKYLSVALRTSNLVGCILDSGLQVF